MRPAFSFGNPTPVPARFADKGRPAAAPQIQVVLNSSEELKARVPVK
jgi:hypothetical protein